MTLNFLKKKNSQGGYIALISIIIIVALLMIITVAVSFSGFFSRFGILDNEYKEVSSALAEACADTAILNLAENWSNPEIPPGGIVHVGPGADDICNIVSIEPSGGGSSKTIKVQASSKNSYTNLKIMVNNGGVGIGIDSWLEKPNFSI
jgi:hypothetical protein